jgi:uncharacterized protein (DUF433 family)
MPVAQKVKPKHPYIASLKSHCGGSPIIAGTKFPVRSVVLYVLRQGMSPEELVKEFSHQSLSGWREKPFRHYRFRADSFQRSSETNTEMSRNQFQGIVEQQFDLAGL